MATKTDDTSPPAKVIVTDFDMEFGSMVMFLVKLALAAIPAAIILALFAGLAAVVIKALG